MANDEPKVLSNYSYLNEFQDAFDGLARVWDYELQIQENGFKNWKSLTIAKEEIKKKLNDKHVKIDDLNKKELAWFIFYVLYEATNIEWHAWASKSFLW